MKRATIDQKQRIVEILSRSFDNNPSVNYVVKPGPGRGHRIRKLMEYSYDMCDAFGEVWISDEGHGCTLILMPDKKRTSLRALFWDLKLAISAIGLRRVNKVMSREARIKAFHPLQSLNIQLDELNRRLEESSTLFSKSRKCSLWQRYWTAVMVGVISALLTNLLVMML